ncbi:dihydrodipicolinate synthase family protein [Streptomyces sp. NPDC054950]|uniref:dihydrodipicolinate synthase family protein n=1 Tax=unclassified Streptomyces TaxID=2593676 RepID=UPI0006BB091E|nr:Dihydrodipicolinate synthase [Actinobacteria bacterium OV320]
MAVFSGVHAALLTAFDADGALDTRATAALATDLTDRGVHGLVVNGSTGEFASLSTEERRLNLETVIAAVGDRTQVTAQVGAMTTADAVASTEHALKAGAVAGMLVCPYYEAIDEREVEAYFRTVAEVGLPLMIYNNPSATGWSMRPEFIAELATIDGVRFLKDTTPEVGRLFRIRQLCGDSIEILSGQDSVALAGFLAGGARATVWGAVNAVPEACVRLWELAVLDRDAERAREFWQRLYPLTHFFETHGYAQAVKTATNLRGVDVGVPRLPALPVETSDIDELRQLLRLANEAVAQFGRPAAAQPV